MPTTHIAERDLVELLYQDKSGPLTIDSQLLDRYLAGCATLGQSPSFSVQQLPATAVEAAQQWNTPQEFIDLELDVFFANKVTTVEEAIRVADELALFKERGLEPMLRFMIYLVQVMKDNNVVWGVGRGSSVSSFLLYLAGLHSVNSVKYDLDIKEFIR